MEKYTTILQEVCKISENYGLKNNPYNLCVVNTTTNGQYMTVTWYVDYLKVSQKDPIESTKFICYPPSIYGE